MTILLKNRAKNIFICLFFFTAIFQHSLSAQNAIQVAGTATKTATQSGNWTTTATWGGSLPTTGARIAIPAGITVTVDTEITTEFKSLKIEGKLKFAPNVNTELRVEYLVSTMMGALEIGTTSTPIANGVTAKLVFADLGGTSTTEDPERFAPGAVLMGPVAMRGQQKTSWTTLATQPNAGTSVLQLSSSPTGWQKGDKLVVAATDLGDPTSDDVVEINSINGTTVNLTSALIKSHKAPAQASDLAVHVANLSRNIKISSANTSVSAKLRGHIMFMHNLEVDIRFVELTNTGRTDKSQKLNDYTWDDLQESPSYTPPRGAFTNPRGRYSIHFHRGGINPVLTPAHVEGVTVNNDPGWAFVNHSSRVNFIRNVSYDIVGSAFCTESGDETGSFIENIALRTVNPSDPFANLREEEALIDVREEVQDFAWQGDAFWFHSTGLSVEGNVAAGVSGHAFIFWPEGLIENGLGMRRGTPTIHVPDPTQAALLNGVPNNFVFECWFIPQQSFKNNTAYTTTKGLTIFYLHTRFLDEVEEKYNIPPEAYRRSLNAVFDGIIIWNIKYKGIDMFFSSDITIQNSRIVGYGSASSVVGMDLDHFHNLDDWFFINNKVEGFNNNNIGLSPPTNAKVTIDGGNYNNSATDIGIRETNFHLEIDDVPSNSTPNRTMTISNMNFSNPNRNIVLQPELILNQPAEDGFDFAEDIKDELYFGLDDHITLNYGPFQNATLYFDQQAADFIPITNANYKPIELPDEPTGVSIPVAYRNKTNAQLQTIFNPPSSFGGDLMPATAVAHPSIVGGKVSAISANPCETAIPVAPTSLTATNNNCTSISLSWSSVLCATSYQIDRKVGTGNWATLNASVGSTNFTDNSPAAESNQYRIRAQNANGNSSFTTSNSINCTPVPPTQFTLIVNTAGTGSGTVLLSPAGGTYDEGTTVLITATANSDSQFDNWSGDLIGDFNPISIIMGKHQVVTAHFSALLTNNCPTDYLFSNSRGLSGTASGTQRMETNGEIESTQTVTTGADITYDSKVQITLRPEFHAVTGATFRAMIDGCPTGGLTNNETANQSTIENISLEEEKIVQPETEDNYINIQRLSSFQENAIRSIFALFPNPTNGHFNIKTNLEDYSIQVFSLNGQLLLDWSNRVNPTAVNISHLQAGMYLVKVIDKQNRNIDYKKIIKTE